jgi:trigger factor
MKVELQNLSETRKSLAVEVPSEAVDHEIERLSQDYRRTLKIPGFRPGKAPIRLVRARLHDQILHEVAQALIPKAVDEAIRDHGLQPIASPTIRDVKTEEGQPLTFTALFEVLPLVEPGEYKGLTLRRPPIQVTDESVTEAVQRLRKHSAHLEPVEGRGVENGDTVTIDLERRVIKTMAADSSGHDGPESHGDIEIEIGGSSNPPGFDEELIGMSLEETKDFVLSYPDDHESKGLAGTEVAYKIKLKLIRRKILPELNDEFARDLGKFDSLESLTTQVKADLASQAELDADGQVRSEILRKLANSIEGEVPEALIDQEIDRRVQRFVEHLIAQRVDPRQANIDWDTFREEQREPATATVRSMLVIDEIAKKESLTVREEEIDAELQRQAERSGRTVSAARALLGKDGGMVKLEEGLRREKTIDFILNQATIVTA